MVFDAGIRLSNQASNRFLKGANGLGNIFFTLESMVAVLRTQLVCLVVKQGQVQNQAIADRRLQA